MNEHSIPEEVKALAKKIIERFLVPEAGYKSLSIEDVLKSFNWKDNSANRELINSALEFADELSKPVSLTEEESDALKEFKKKHSKK